MKPDLTVTPRTQRFQAIVLPHLDAAYNLARWLMRSDRDAEDIVQEACLRAYRSFDGFRGDDARPWLLKIVRNACYTWFATNLPAALATTYDDEIHGGSEDVAGSGCGIDPATLAARADTRRVVNAALAQLPIPFREAVVLCDMEELSYKEIAAIAGIPMGTVMSRIARGRRLLSTLLAPAMKDG